MYQSGIFEIAHMFKIYPRNYVLQFLKWNTALSTHIHTEFKAQI